MLLYDSGTQQFQEQKTEVQLQYFSLFFLLCCLLLLCTCTSHRTLFDVAAAMLQQQPHFEVFFLRQLRTVLLCVRVCLCVRMYACVRVFLNTSWAIPTHTSSAFEKHSRSTGAVQQQQQQQQSRWHNLQHQRTSHKLIYI